MFSLFFSPPFLAQFQALEPASLELSHIQVNMAPKLRRRTYRAHGRINPYQSSPCHIELIFSQEAEAVKGGESESGKKKGRKAGKLANGASA